MDCDQKSLWGRRRRPIVVVCSPIVALDGLVFQIGQGWRTVHSSCWHRGCSEGKHMRGWSPVATRVASESASKVRMGSPGSAKHMPRAVAGQGSGLCDVDGAAPIGASTGTCTQWVSRRRVATTRHPFPPQKQPWSLDAPYPPKNPLQGKTAGRSTHGCKSFGRALGLVAAAKVQFAVRLHPLSAPLVPGRHQGMPHRYGGWGCIPGPALSFRGEPAALSERRRGGTEGRKGIHGHKGVGWKEG